MNCLVVKSVEVSSIKLNAKGIGTIGKLHQDFWKKQYHKAHVKNDIDSPYYKKFNYILIPRGRIFYNNGEFIVMVGDWLTDPQYEVDINELRELLIDEFDLPENFKFQQDEHWNIGRGWSERGFQINRKTLQFLVGRAQKLIIFEGRQFESDQGHNDKFRLFS